MTITRRTATATLFTAALSTLTATAASAEKASGKAARYCLTVLYPWQADARFDFEYYQKKHLTQLGELYGKAVGKMEVHKGLRKGDGSAPAFIASVTIEILSMDAFDAAGKEHLPKLMADLPNFSNVIPVGQIEEIL